MMSSVFASHHLSSIVRWIVAAWLVCVASPAGAQQRLLERSYDKNGDTRLEIEAVFSSGATHGYLPVRVTIRNATAQDRTWDLDFNFGSSYREMAYRSSFSVPVDAGRETVQDLLVPVPTSINSGGSYRQFTVRATSGGLPSATQADGVQSNSNWPGIAISKKLADRNLTRLNSEASSRGSGRTDAFGASFDPEMLPSDWRGYSSLDLLMMTEEEWGKLAPGARLAILEWVRLGGRLDLYTRKPEAEKWLVETELLEAGSLTQAGARRGERGLGEIHAWTWNGQDLNASQVVGRYASISNLAKELAEEYSRDWPLLRSFGSKSFNAVLVVLLLIAFGIVVGPVNLFVLAKPGRRHRLFVTTPVISLVASLLILAIILLGDGIGGAGRRAVLANLEPGPDEKRLYVIQEQISRSGVLLGTGFRIEDPVFLSPVLLPPSAWNRFDLSKSPIASFSLTGETYRGDWFQSRSEQGHYLQTVRPTRSRIELQSAAANDSPPKLFSSLEFEIDEFYYRDEQGRVWRKPGTASVVGGEQVPLEASTEDALEKWWKLNTTSFSAPLRRQCQAFDKKRGHFFATSTDSGAGFVDTLGSIRWKEDVAVIHGSVLAEGGGGGDPQP